MHLPDSACVAGPSPATDPFIYDGGFILLLAAITCMIWGLTFVCEEYSIPAITVFCKRNRISDDVAGAIFIGTGLSLPVLFASFVGLFASNSSIGAGTVVGGNIFNQLLNVALSIQAAPNKTLVLDGVIITRETLFYLLSCLLIVWATEGTIVSSFQHAFNHTQWLHCLEVSLNESLILLGGYVFYCIFDAYFNKMSECLLQVYNKTKQSTGIWYSATRTNDHTGPHQQNRSTFVVDSSTLSESNNRVIRRHTPSTEENDDLDIEIVFRGDEEHNSETSLSPYSAGKLHQLEVQLPVTVTALSTHVATIAPLRVTANHDPLEDFDLFIKSKFYAKHDFGCFPSSRKWKLRYFTFNNNGLFYKLDHELPMRGNHVRFIDVFDLEEVTVVDSQLFEFKIVLRTKRKSYSFRAPTVEIFDAVVARLYEFLDDIKKRPDSELRAMALKSMNEIIQGVDEIPDGDDDSVGETAFVYPATPLWQCWYYFILPLKLMVYFTTPDVRHNGSEHKAIMSTLISFAWLGAMTYVLIDCLSILANMLHINGSVMGLTIGAWAASYPAAWSSIVVARNGYGNIAMCNALGSNVFNNYIGLGLPWFTYILVYGQKPYVMQDQGIVLSMIVLGIVMIATHLMLALNNFVLKEWMIMPMWIVYIIFIAYFVYFSLTLN